MSRGRNPGSTAPLPPGVERRRRLRLERRRDFLIQSWRFLILGLSATALGWILLSQGWTLRNSDQLTVEGSQHLRRDAVIRGGNLTFPLALLSLQPRELEQVLLEALPVQAVSVQRRLLPPGLFIELEDRRPLASATRQGPRGLERGLVDHRGEWMPRSAIEQGAMPETEIEVRGWTAGRRGLLEVVLNQRDRLGSQLQTVDLEADGSLTLRTAALGLVRLGQDPRLLAQQLTTISQLSRSLPSNLRTQPGGSIDISDPRKPELLLPEPSKSKQANKNQPKTSEP